MASRRPRVRMLLGGTLLVGLLAVAVGATLGAHYWKKDLRVQSVDVMGNRVLSTEEILRLAAVPIDTGLYDVDLRAVQLRVASHLYIAHVAVSRNVPDGITIEVTEREPVAILPAGRLLALDAEGRVLPPARTEALFDLPVLTGIPPREMVPGTVLEGSGVHQALLLIRMAESSGDELYRRISEVHIRADSTLLVYTSESGVPVLFGRGDLARKLVTFDGFWRTIVSRRGVTALLSVDMRFADQVVARWQ
jgi:cell division protein FtsQ